MNTDHHMQRMGSEKPKRRPRFEIVQSDTYPELKLDQPWHARFVSSNGRIVWSTEQYSEKASAKNAVAVVAQAFCLTKAYFTFRGDDLFIYSGGVGCPVIDVDERTKP